MAKSDKKEKKSMGRPSKYKKKYCKELIEHFTVETTKEIVLNDNEKVVPNEVPTFMGFAAKISVNIDTLHQWRKDYPEFSEAYSIAKSKQGDFIVRNASTNMMGHGFAKFMMQNNFGWKEKTENTEKKTISLSSSEIDGLSVEQAADEIRKLLES